MTPIIYYYKFRYYRWTTRPVAKSNALRLVHEEKGEDDRYWQQSTRERFEQARYYGKRVKRTPRIIVGGGSS